MFSKQKNSWRLIGALCVLAGVLSGCSSKDDELDQFIADTKKEPGGRVEPLPELKPYESYAYESANLRSPFMPGGSGGELRGALRPDIAAIASSSNNSRSIRCAWSARCGCRIARTGLIKTKDGLVHRVLPGKLPGPGGRQGHRDIAFED